MGSDNTIIEKKQRFLPKSEINKENNLYLRDLYLKYKNFDGYVTQYGLHQMMNGLIDKSIVDIIFKFCCSRENRFLFKDFLYFYAILKTKSFDGKTNFLLYFIFEDEPIIKRALYIKRVTFYYHNSHLLYKILLNEKITNNNQKIEKEDVFDFIKDNYKEEIENYQLNKEICAFKYVGGEEDEKELERGKIDDDKTNMAAEIGDDKEDSSLMGQSISYVDKIRNSNIEENSNINNGIIAQENISRRNSFNKHLLINEQKSCLCLTNKKNSICYSIDFYRLNVSLYNKYESLKEKFEEYKNNHNGVFPLSILENMLKEINVVPSLIDLISNYIKKKTQKGICTFELFKQIFSVLNISLDNEEKRERNKQIFTDGLFLLFSYPNNFIDKTTFCSFIQMTKNDYSLNSINILLNKYEVPKRITIDKFKELVDYLINLLMESLEHIKYIPYIFFDINFKDRKIEKHIIDILLNGEEVNEYVKKRINIDDRFYVIDCEFWNKWNELMNTQKYEELYNLKINAEKICDQNGKINEGLVYLKDYMILPKRIYDLFCKWYNTPSIDLEREKIFIEDEEENHLYYQNFNQSDKDVALLFQGEDMSTHKKCEIEINPVFLVFLNFQDVQITCKNSLSKFKEEIKSKLEDSKTIFYKFSRKEKFAKLLTILQDSVDMELDENNSRLWIYYQDRFEMVPNEDSLEKQGIFNKAAILLEINKSGRWPMDEFSTIKNNIIDDDKFLAVGIMNLGNSCYMNSILQILLNISEIRNIFVNIKMKKEQEFLDFLINYKSEKEILVEEFIDLLIEKWVRNKKTLSPKKFKEACGKLNENFKGYIQQDAYDFYTFLVQNLHEGTNIKSLETNIINKEKIETTEKELGNEYWSNTVRNNASYIYSLFMGQLQSKLICNKCEKCKIKYEPYSALDLPLPEENDITLYIKLYRLPYLLCPFYKENKNKETMADYLKNIKKINHLTKKDLRLPNNSSTEDIREKKKYDISMNEQSNIEMESNEKLNSLNKRSSKDELIANELNLNIPIKLKINISRKKNCEEIITVLKEMDELCLDKTNKYTEFIIISEDKYISQNLLIDDTLQAKKEIEIYELLNFEGIKKVFNYSDLVDSKASRFNNEELNSVINHENENGNTNIEESDINNEEKEELKQSLIEVKHRLRKNAEGEDYIVSMPVYSEIPTYRDFIILANKKSIKIFDLYEMMWEKYMYFCDVPSKLENDIWWRNIINKKVEEYFNNIVDENLNVEQEEKKKNEEKIKKCTPFVLKVINKTTKACAYCPWFRLCTGCILDPTFNEYISIPKDCYLVVEWCRKVKVKQIKDENPLLYLSHSSMNNEDADEQNSSKKLSIYDCFDLFTKNEKIEDIFCENCGEKQTFTKILKIERIPEYLVISLKRFKYTSMYRTKINCTIKFPMKDLDLNKYLIEGSQQDCKSYDLLAVVNHNGDLNSGHYNCIIKNDNNWIKYNDSVVSKLTKTFDTKDAYILVYHFVKDKNHHKYFDFNFKGLMDTAFKIYQKQEEFNHLFNYLINEKGEIIEEYKEDCKFYYGEPVTVDKTKGYLINLSESDGSIYAKVKIGKSCLTIKYAENKIIKDTIKDNKITKNEKNKIGEVKCGCNIY